MVPERRPSRTVSAVALFVLAVVLVLCLRAAAASYQSEPYVRRSGPPILTFDELVALSTARTPEEPTVSRLTKLLNTPFISNEAYYDGATPHAPSSPALGRFLRVVMWNIDKALEFDRIRTALTDPDGLRKIADAESGPGVRTLAQRDWEVIRSQVDLIRDADILILNEVEDGITRSGYRDETRELAAALHMNYVFGVEFVEVDPLDLGLEAVRIDDDPEAIAEVKSSFTPDRDRYRGLHGGAILSRYPIRHAELRPLPLCYDWYGKEQNAVSVLEAGKRWGSEVAFLERISREIRRGARTVIIAELDVPEAPTGRLTVVAPHLENKCQPDCRRGQMREILTWIRDVDGPVVMGGDLNTTGADAAPTSMYKIVNDRIIDPEFWGRKAVKYAAAPVMTIVNPVKYGRNYSDPTGKNVPVVAPKREAALFKDVKAFRFSDGTAFDFRGTASQTSAGMTGTLGNSNERAGKGFHYTFALTRNYGGVVGRYKIDWFFVKGEATNPTSPGQPYAWAPHFARTLRELNELNGRRLSDHAPITVDIPVSEPPKVKRAQN